MKEGYQPRAVAKSETKRGTSDALRLLHDGQARDPEAARRLQGEDGRGVLAAGLPRPVHRAGPLPLPLVREAMLGERGELF